MLDKLRKRIEQKPYKCPRCGHRGNTVETMRLSGKFRVTCTNPTCSWTTGWQPPPIV